MQTDSNSNSSYSHRIISCFFPQGSSPKIKIKVAKAGKNFTLKCNATGYPQPTVMVKFGDKQEAGITVEIKKGLTYQFIAHNGFGSAVGGVYQSKISAFFISKSDCFAHIDSLCICRLFSSHLKDVGVQSER